MSWLLWLACTAAPPVAEAPPPHAPPTVSPARPPAVQPAQPPTGRGAHHETPEFNLLPAQGEQHSVLIVSLDTVRADDLAVYGGPAASPALSALAAQGLRYDQAVSHLPETCLSHWSVMSGVLPALHGNAPVVGGSIWRGPTVAEIARRHGYATAAFIGGVTLTDMACGLARGFQTYDDSFPLQPGEGKREGAEVARRAVRWIGEQTGPWLAFVHLFDAHFPYDPPPALVGPAPAGVTLTGSDADLRPFRDGGQTPSADQRAWVRALYDGELTEDDDYLGRVLAAVGPDTVVVVLADHGESFGHDYWFNHRDVLWQSVLHVPLVIRAPGLGAGVVTAPVGLIDVAPTVLRLAGLPVDRGMQGVDVAGVAPPEDREIYSITDPWRGTSRFSARRGSTKLIEQGGDAAVFDLTRDSAELHPDAAVSPALEGARARYDAMVVSGASALPHREIDPAEAQMLKSLGYLVP